MLLNSEFCEAEMYLLRFDIEVIIIQKTQYSKETTKAGKKHEKIPERHS